MKLTKRIISLLMAVLMLCSGMVVTAFADGETTEGDTTTTTPAVEVVKHTLNKDNCYVNVENVEIVVKAATAKVNGEDQDIVFTATQSDDASKTLRGLKDPETGDTIFTNPTTGKTYSIIGKVTINGLDYGASNKFDVKVLKSQNAPAVTSPKKVTSIKIELNSVSGCEYRIEKDGEWKAWQTTTVFENLNPGTAYKIEMRYKETATHYASAAVSLTVKTLEKAGTNYPDEIFLVDKTDKTITVAAYEKIVVEHEDGSYYYFEEAKDVEYSIDDGKTWQVTGAFTGLKADTTYTIVSRYTHDKTVQEANPSSLPKEFITNARESYPADLKKCTFKADDGNNYANEAISFTVVADTAPAKYEAQYGDTKYVPVYYTVSGLSGAFYFNPSKDGKTYTASFVPGDANADKKVEVTVYYQKQKCHGEDDNGKAVWSDAGEIEKKTYKVQVGEVHTFFTDVRDFFLGIFNALFNTIPGTINGWLSGFDFNGVLKGASGLLDMLGGVDLGGLTGTTTK